MNTPTTDAIATHGTHVIAHDAAGVTGLLPMRPGAVATRRILKAPGFTAVRIALDEGETMREHQAAVPILIQVVEGTVDIDTEGVVTRFDTGGSLYVAARVPHSLYGVTAVHLLLILADHVATSGQTSDHDHHHDGHDHASQHAAGVAVDAHLADLTTPPAGVTPLVLSEKSAHPADCTCGEEDAREYPELDVRTVPHAIRHAVVLGALDSLGTDGGIVLVAGHDPLPLLRQIGGRHGDRFEVTYLERGPEAWRLQLASVLPDSAA